MGWLDDVVPGAEADRNDVTGGGVSGAAGGDTAGGSATLDDFTNSRYQLPLIQTLFPSGLSADGELLVNRDTLRQVAVRLQSDIAMLQRLQSSVADAPGAAALSGWTTADQFQGTLFSASGQFQTAIGELHQVYQLLISALNGSASNYEDAESATAASANSIQSAGGWSGASGSGSDAYPNGNPS